MSKLDHRNLSNIIAMGIVKELDMFKIDFQLKAPSQNERLIEVTYKDQDYTFYILGEKVRELELEKQ